MSSLRGKRAGGIGPWRSTRWSGNESVRATGASSPPSIVCLIVSLPATNQGARTYERRRSFAHRGMSAMCSRFSIIQAVYNALG